MGGSKTAIVIGAGLSGLAAAWQLQRAGFSVKVLEKNAFPGGRVRSLREKGFIMDTGPDAISRGYVNYLALASEVGLGGQIVDSSTLAGALRDGHLHTIDTASLRSMLSTRLLSLPAKLRFALGMLRIRPLMKNLDNFQLVKSADLDDPEINADEFGQRHFGREVTQYLIDPLMRLVNGTGASDTTLLDVLGGLKAWSQPLVSLLGGLDVLPVTLAQKLDVQYNSAIEQVVQSESETLVTYRDQDKMTQTTRADVCVISTMFEEAEKIYPPLGKMVGDFTGKIRYIRLISVQLGYARQTDSKAYAVQIPTSESADILLIFLQHNKAPDRAPAGHSLFTVYTDSAQYDELARRSDKELITQCSAAVERYFPELKDHLELTHVARWPQAGYLAYPGYFRHTAEMMKKLPIDQRIQIAGDLFGAGSMESAVTWGSHAATNLIKHYG